MYKRQGLQGSIVLDAWKNCGHLVVLTQKDREGGKWEEDWREPVGSKAFPEGHSYGMDHHLVWPGWARKRPLRIQRIFPVSYTHLAGSIVRGTVAQVDAGAEFPGDHGNGQGAFRAQSGGGRAAAVCGIFP